MNLLMTTHENVVNGSRNSAPSSVKHTQGILILHEYTVILGFISIGIFLSCDASHQTPHHTRIYTRMWKINFPSSHSKFSDADDERDAKWN